MIKISTNDLKEVLAQVCTRELTECRRLGVVCEMRTSESQRCQFVSDRID